LVVSPATISLSYLNFIVSSQQIKNSLLPTLVPQDVADALNEQGFLFQQIIRDKINSGTVGNGEWQQPWKILANEYPVTAIDGSQTRIDLLLCHSVQKHAYICMECKRPNPKYKSWLFFDRSASQFFIEDGRMEPGKGYESGKPIDYKTMISTQFDATGVQVFNFYLEATVKKSSSDKASNSETIEKALRQLIAGHTGMMNKLRFFEQYVVSFYRSIPVIVTTAQLFEVGFNSNDVSLEAGTIDSSLLKLTPHKFCAINYHPDDSLSVKREHTYYRKEDVSSDLSFFQTRTVFIVHASATNEFLVWAGEHLIKHP
jgi:hypothetical protein